MVENALKHTPPGTPVEVTGSVWQERRQRWVSLRVVDHGRGVPAASLDQLFAPFQRLGDVPQGDGLGLGLAVARGLTEAMGGTVSAEETPGGGTDSGDRPTGRRGGYAAGAGTVGRSDGAGMTRVLAVDDDPSILRTLQINLRARTYEIETVRDGRSALQAIHEQMPDLVLLDLGLPDLDGIAVLEELRSFSKVPVIVLSARHESDDKVEALDLGADDYVTKPFAMDELLARVRAALRHTNPGGTTDQTTVEAGTLRLDVAEARATRNGIEVHLTPTEWLIVKALIRRPGQLVRQVDLLREVWGPAYHRETNYLRVYLAQLRRKLEDEPGQPRHFKTEPGLGYRFIP